MESLRSGEMSNHGLPVLLFFPLLLGSAMVAMFVTPLWCIEELFVVKPSEVLIMMVSKLAQAGAAALDTKSTASPDVSWFPLLAPSPASCVTVDKETCLFHVLSFQFQSCWLAESAFFIIFPLSQLRERECNCPLIYPKKN